MSLSVRASSPFCETAFGVPSDEGIDESTSFGRGVVLSQQIASKFLNFFQHHRELPHQPIANASILPRNDPTLLFVNSGMAPLKAFFTGEAIPPAKRLCNVQPCVRTNDIDDIGDRHHLSLFHMMGSWSIGDYYKPEAVRLAFDLLVNRFGFPKERIYATYFAGDDELGLEPDLESAQSWIRAGLAPNQVVPLPKDDNLWGPAGETGPCGPCTEVFYDTGDAFAPPYEPGKSETFDTKRRYIEIWNAGVFMQLYKHEDGTFTPLALKSVDTGSGLERMTMTMNGHESVYDTDLLKPIVDGVREFYAGAPISSKDVRILTDHIRTATFILSEGVAPGNTGQGYIVRKLIRRFASAAARISPGKPDFKPLLGKVVDFLAASHPRVKENEAFITAMFCHEMEGFRKTLDKGMRFIDAATKTLAQGDPLPGSAAHALVATHGIPPYILADILQQRGIAVDWAGYDSEVKRHQELSRKKNS